MKPTAKQLYESWVKLNAHQQALGRTVLRMLAHPDATPEQVQDAAARYRASAQSIREVQERTVKALYSLPYSSQGSYYAGIVRTHEVTP